MTGKSIHYALLATIMLFSGYLIFKNLGDAALWSDEAETAIVARNFLNTGHCTGWDGRNLLTDRNGACLDKNLNDRNPPLQFVVTAASFALLGVNNFSARLPFALIGLLTVLLLYLTIRLELPDRPAAALYGAGFLGLFTEYILYVRNDRYYALACFAALLTFLASRRFMRKPNGITALGLLASAIFLFYSHMLIGVAVLIPLALYYVLFENGLLTKKHWLHILSICLLFALATVPYAFLHRLWERPDMPHGVPQIQHLTILLWFLRDSVTSGIAPWAIVAAAAALILTRALEPKTLALMRSALFILVGQIMVIGLISLQEPPKDPGRLAQADIRYLVGCFPFTAMLFCGLLASVHQRSRLLAPALGAVLVSTNCLYALPVQNRCYLYPHSVVYSPLYDYWQEIHHHYRTAAEAVAGFLRHYALRNETFHAWPEYRNDPLLFYTGSDLIGSCGLDSTTSLGAARVKALSPFLLENENFPDWIIFMGMFAYGPEVMRHFSRTIVENDGFPGSNDYEFAGDLAVYPDETTRPEIFQHHFGAITSFGQPDHVIIFHKVPQDPDTWLVHFPRILQAGNVIQDPAMPFRDMQKLFGLYLQNSALVKKHYSRGTILACFNTYRQMLVDRNMLAEANALDRFISKQ